MVQVRGRKLQVAALALLVCLTACQTPSAGFCAISKPIRPSEQTIDAMTDAEIMAVLSFNEKGRKLCGWKI